MTEEKRDRLQRMKNEEQEKMTDDKKKKQVNKSGEEGPGKC